MIGLGEATSTGSNPQTFTICNYNKVFTDPLYGKLIYLTEKLIFTIPYYDCFDQENLLKYIKVSLNLNKMYPDILCPDALCPEPFEIVLTELSSFGEFHKVLNSFIPAKKMNTLAQDLFYRPQGHREKLHLFMNEIKEVLEILLIDKSEAEVVNLIIKVHLRGEKLFIFHGLLQKFWVPEQSLCYVWMDSEL